MTKNKLSEYFLGFSNIVNNIVDNPSKYSELNHLSDTITKIYNNIKNVKIESFILSKSKDFNNTPYENIFKLMYQGYTDIKKKILIFK